jgi:hypothetical protein
MTKGSSERLKPSCSGPRASWLTEYVERRRLRQARRSQPGSPSSARLAILSQAPTRFALPCPGHRGLLTEGDMADMPYRLSNYPIQERRMRLEQARPGEGTTVRLLTGPLTGQCIGGSLIP